MRPLLAVVSLVLLLGAPVAPLAAQQPERPRPYPVFESPGFRTGLEKGTRTRTGRPGPRYWQQYARYDIRAGLDPARNVLTGNERVVYLNRSPDTLRVLAVHLRQNANAPGAMRDRFQPVTPGMTLTRVAAAGAELTEPAGEAYYGPPPTAGYAIVGTVLWLRLPSPLLPGDSVPLEFAWSFEVPPKPNSRFGQDGEVWFVGYWYPQVAVYDDMDGWVADQFMTNAEFYMDYADYDVALELPAGWLVSATGTLLNAAGVLTPGVRQRLAAARAPGRIVHVVTADGRGPGRATTGGARSRLTWRFSARNVRDFAWATSDRFVWDATAAVVDAGTRGEPGGRRGERDTVAINAFYRPEKGYPYTEWARYARTSIEFLSGYLWAYPWSHMDVVDGTVAGMEYPMLVNITGARDSLALYSLTLHEIGHMWFPMMVGSDERRHSWQDEGVNTFVEQQGTREFLRGDNRSEAQAREQYLELARKRSPDGEWIGGEVELMRHGDLYPPISPVFATVTYQKTSVVLQTLRGLIGEETVHRALVEYGRRWMFRHPDAFDFFNAFNDVAARDLGWFWRTWFFETWWLDPAVAGVRVSGDSATVEIEDRGLAPMPTPVRITRSDRSHQELEVPVEVWLSGARHAALRVPASPAIVRVEIDPDGLYADVDRSNDVFTVPRTGTPPAR